MATFTTQEIKAHNENTMAEIKALEKPLNAYHLYCQAMREHWNWLADCEKNKYIEKAQAQAVLYEEKKEEILEKAREKKKDSIPAYVARSNHFFTVCPAVPHVALKGHTCIIEIRSPPHPSLGAGTIGPARGMSCLARHAARSARHNAENFGQSTGIVPAQFQERFRKFAYEKP